MSSTKKEQPQKFYSLDRINSRDCHYNMIIGERSNGKTYSCLKQGLENFVNKGEHMAYIRRYREDFRGNRGNMLFSSLVNDQVVSQLTDEEYDNVKYQSGRWYLAKKDPDLNKLVSNPEPFCFAFALSDMEHDKSTSFPNITTIVFDEFLTRKYYLPEEFVLFMNILSTIIRHRNNVKIYMLGNTVNKYCPYFKEMGLRHVADMELGKIDIYNYGTSGLRVAVERCASPNKGGKKSDIYFAFDNPHLEMITGGAWEIGMYPHLPTKYKQSDVLLTYFILFGDNTLQCEIILKDNTTFTYIHQKTTPIQDEDNDIIFSEEYDHRPNHFRNIRKPTKPYTRKIADYFREDKVFYQDNEVGEIVRNYLQFCKVN